MELVLLTCILGFFIIPSEGSATLTVPTAGNCRDDTVLTCSVTDSIGNIGWYGLDRTLFSGGTPNRPEDNNKYTEAKGTTSFTLTIHNTSITDEGQYRCRNGFIESQPVSLSIECKASAAVPSVTNGKKVTVTVDKLYPSSPTFSASFWKETVAVSLPGSRTCSSSTQYPGYYTCVWSSSNSLDYGTYTYSIVVTTITQADPLTGSFRIVSPPTPVIHVANTVSDGNRVVVNEGQSLTIQCTSTGGYPSPTVVWYKDSVSGSNQLASTSTGTLQNDGTYTVSLQHTFTPTVSDDRKSFICRSYYPQADSAYRDSKNTSVELFLTLKPSQPTVTQVRDVSVGGTVEVRGTTTGSRPAANITWSYQGSTYTGAVTSTLDPSTETYTVVSVFRRTVTAADNGHSLKCAVTHTTLISPSERTASINLDVQFSVPASTTIITGNKVMTATGSATLTLTCTTGSSNPASDITWKNGSDSITSNRPYTTSAGDNNGVVRSQHLVLTPTRYMDGDVITCTVLNIVSQSPVTDTATLNLNYRPLIDPMYNITAVEGSNTLFPCKASSKPTSTFRWYKQGLSGVLHQGTGTLDSNQLAYTKSNVRRTDAGTYRCTADNGVETADEKTVLLTVYYPPVLNVVTTNTTIKEQSVSIICNASGIPIPNTGYSYGKWIQKWPGSDVILSEHTGKKNLQLNTLTYEHSGVYSCSASNGIKVFGTDNEYMEGSAILLVKSYPIMIHLSEKVSGKLKENVTLLLDYYSNVEGSDVKCYKNVNGSRQTDFIYTVSKSHVEVDLPVFLHKIKTDGTRSTISIMIDSKEKFGFYDIVVSNEINSTVRSIEIVPLDQAITFYVEGHSDQSFATVDEQDVGVNFTCLVDDSKTSTISIQFKGQILKEASETNYISYLRSNVECSHAGVYTCTRTSIYGQTTKDVNLSVKCSPRPLRQVKQNITSQLYVPVTLSFTALAYPEPGPKGFSWHKENGIRWTLLLSNEDLQIVSSGLQSNLTIWNVSLTGYSQYRVTVTNSVGSYKQYLFLTRDVTYTDNKKDESDNSTLIVIKKEESNNSTSIVGLTLGSVCIFLVLYATFVTILYKRKAGNKGLESSNNSNGQSTYVNLAYNSDVKGKKRKQLGLNNTDDQQVTEEGSPHQYSDLSQFTRDDKATYDILQAN